MSMGRKLAAAAIVSAMGFLLAAPTAFANTYDWANTPDPFILSAGGRYYAYSTNQNVRNCSGNYQRMFVPHRSSPSLRTFGTLPHPACFSDVMPGGPGAWATPSNGLVWAPTVYRNPDNGRYVLFYTGENLYVRLNYGRSQMCIGRAESASPGGPFAPDLHPLICPGDNNHWAIDPNVWVSPASHNVFVQWRQDVGTSESRIYGARYSRDGRTRLTTARLLLSDSAVSWEGAQIENPAIELKSGIYYLFFSGDNWNSKNYATGVAACGSRIVDGGKCKSIYASSRPWLGWSGRPGGAFFHTPEDIWGPGGLSFVSNAGGGIKTNPNGDPYVAIHWWLANDLRPMAIYALPWSIYGPVPANF